MHVSVFVPARALYSDLDESIDCLASLVRQLSRTDALLWCGRLNLVLSNWAVGHGESQQYAVDRFFPDQEERVRLNGWVRSQSNPEVVSVFFRGQLLELARAICIFGRDREDDGATFESLRDRRLFAQAALVAGDVWGARVYPTFPDRSEIESDVRRARQGTMHTVRSSSAENAGANLPYAALGRGAQIWRHMASRCPDLERIFQEHAGISLDEYFENMAALFMGHIDIRPSTEHVPGNVPGMFDHRFWARAPHMRESFERFMRLEAIELDALAQRMRASNVPGGHVRVFRQHPIVRTRDGRSLVVDPTALVHHAALGPLFILRDLASHRAADLFRLNGEAFEAYVAELLQTRYPRSELLVDRIAVQVNLIRGRTTVGELDAVIATGANEVCILESKAGFISDQDLRDGSDYQRTLRKKLGHQGNGKGKGVAQPANAIRELSVGGLSDVPPILTNVRTILPVLLVQDALVDGPGHGDFFAGEFLSTLGLEASSGQRSIQIGPFHVAMPIAVTIDDFEWLEASLGQFALGEFLKAYDAWDPDRVHGIRHFVSTSQRYQELWCRPTAAIDAGAGVLERMGRKAFGSDQSTDSAAT